MQIRTNFFLIKFAFEFNTKNIEKENQKRKNNKKFNKKINKNQLEI